METNFNFYMPIEFSKGKKGEQDVYLFEGLASDGTRDSDGETMSECHFDINKDFYVNYDHEKD